MEKYSAEAPRTNDRAIRTVVKSAFTNGLVPAADRVRLPGRIRLWGEVLAVREGYSRRYLTLLDSEEDDAWIEASVPRSEPVPAVGDMVAIDGQLTFKNREKNLTVGLELVGDTLTPRGDKSKRYDRWRRHFEMVRDQTVGRPSPESVARIALVTGEGSVTVGDIRSRAGQPDGLELPIEKFSVPLDKPGAIAAEIRKAAAMTEADVLVIARGGGHVGELNVFNHPDVISAIGYAREKVPVVTAIGHAQNEVWADLLAADAFPVPAAVGDWLRRKKNRIGPQRALRRAPAASSAPAPSRRRRAGEVFGRFFASCLLVLAGWLAREVYDWWTRPTPNTRMTEVDVKPPTLKHVQDHPEEPPRAPAHRGPRHQQ